MLGASNAAPAGYWAGNSLYQRGREYRDGHPAWLAGYCAVLIELISLPSHDPRTTCSTACAAVLPSYHRSFVNMDQALFFSLLLPLLALAQNSSSGSELPPAGYNGGSNSPQNADDAGAAGSSNGAFELSSGGLIAIIVVAVIVVIGGSTFTPNLLS